VPLECIDNVVKSNCWLLGNTTLEGRDFERLKGDESLCFFSFLSLLSLRSNDVVPLTCFSGVVTHSGSSEASLEAVADEIELVRAAYISHASTHVLMGFGTQEESNKINIVLIMRRVVLALVGHEKLAIHGNVEAVACCTTAQRSSLKQKNAQRREIVNRETSADG